MRKGEQRYGAKMSDAQLLRRVAADLEEDRAMGRWSSADWVDTDRLRLVAAWLEWHPRQRRKLAASGAAEARDTERRET